MIHNSDWIEPEMRLRFYWKFYFLRGGKRFELALESGFIERIN